MSSWQYRSKTVRRWSGVSCFFCKEKTAYEMLRSLVGSEMCIRDSRWPGNVREMMNAVESAVVLSDSEYISESDLSLLHAELPSQEAAAPVSADLPLEEVEKTTILKTLEISGGNKSEAARKLGITRATLHKKLKKYRVQ